MQHDSFYFGTDFRLREKDYNKALKALRYLFQANNSSKTSKQYLVNNQVITREYMCVSTKTTRQTKLEQCFKSNPNIYIEFQNKYNKDSSTQQKASILRSILLNNKQNISLTACRNYLEKFKL